MKDIIEMEQSQSFRKANKMNAKAKQTLSDVQRLSDVQQVQIRDELLQSHPLTDMTIMTSKGTDIGLKLKRENFEFQICHFHDGSNISLSDNENTVIQKLTKDEMLALQEDIELRYPSEPKVKRLVWGMREECNCNWIVASARLPFFCNDALISKEAENFYIAHLVGMSRSSKTLEQAKAWCQEQFEKEVRGLFV